MWLIQMKHLNLALIFIAALLFSGCTDYDLKPNKTRVFAVIDVVETTKISGALGTHQSLTKTQFLKLLNSAQGFSHIEIKRSIYPRCANHEIAHAFSGNWHKGHNTVHLCDGE